MSCRTRSILVGSRSPSGPLPRSTRRPTSTRQTSSGSSGGRSSTGDGWTARPASSSSARTRRSTNHRPAHSGRRSGAPPPGPSRQARRHEELRPRQHVPLQRLRQREGEHEERPAARRLPQPLARRAARRQPGRGRSGAGPAADEAWQLWKATPAGQASAVVYAAVTHPTQPESSSKGDKALLAAATKKLLQNWNAGLQVLSPAIVHPDVRPAPRALRADLGRRRSVPFPEIDFPAGLPAWMREQDGWAKRAGKDDLAKRRNITITVPKGVIP